jgi:hypothetical protein
MRRKSFPIWLMTSFAPTDFDHEILFPFHASPLELIESIRVEVNKQSKEEKLCRLLETRQTTSKHLFLPFFLESKVSRSKRADNKLKDELGEEKLFNFLEKQERESKSFEQNARNGKQQSKQTLNLITRRVLA